MLNYQVLEGDILEGLEDLIDSPGAPLEQDYYLIYRLGG